MTTVLLAWPPLLRAQAVQDTVVQDTVKSPDGKITLEWLHQDGACTSMRFTEARKQVAAVRFQDACSALKTPFSPDGQWVVFLVGPQGPLHVVPRAMLTGYLEGGMPEAVVYPSENAGMPPNPPRALTFLRWSGPDAFELTGAAQGGVYRYAYRVGHGVLNTCYVDGFRRQCAFPSPDGKHTVLAPFQGFLLAHSEDVPRLVRLEGGQPVRFPSPALPLVRPVFLRWVSADQLLLQAEGAGGQPVEHVYTLSTSTLSPPRPVTVDWTGWPAP